MKTIVKKKNNFYLLKEKSKEKGRREQTEKPCPKRQLLKNIFKTKKSFRFFTNIFNIRSLQIHHKL